MNKKVGYIALIVMSIICAFASPVANAQMLRVHTSDGARHDYKCSEVDSVVMVPYSHEFTVTVDDVKSSSVTITVGCSDPNVAYFFDLCTEDVYKKYNGDMATLIHKYIADMQKDYPQLTQSQILSALREYGPLTETIKQLPSATTMYAYVMAVDDNGQCYGEAAIAKFTTLEGGDPALCTFAIEAQDVSSQELVVNIVPSDPSVKYWYGIVARESYPGDYALMAELKSAFAEAAAANSMTVEQLINRIAYTDELKQPESGLQPATAYYIYAYALKNDGSNAGPIAKYPFTTAEYDISDAMISLSYRYFDGDALCAVDPVEYGKYQGGIMVEAVVTPNEITEHWAVALGSKDMTDPDIYPDESTKNAVLQAGRIDQTSMTFVARYGVATFLYFGADYAGVDGALRRLLVNFTPEGVSSPETLTAKTFSSRMPAKAIDVPAMTRAAGNPLQHAVRSSYRH